MNQPDGRRRNSVSYYFKSERSSARPPPRRGARLRSCSELKGLEFSLTDIRALLVRKWRFLRGAQEAAGARAGRRCWGAGSATHTIHTRQ
jgi:hypothetical protein